jgi:hypothetical protein
MIRSSSRWRPIAVTPRHRIACRKALLKFFIEALVFSLMFVARRIPIFVVDEVIATSLHLITPSEIVSRRTEVV